MADLLRIAGPDLTPAEALLRLGDEAAVAMLHACGLGWTHLAWGLRPARFQAWSELNAPRRDGPEAKSSGIIQENALDRESAQNFPTAALRNIPSAWGRFDGGYFIQADYEFPAVPGRSWPVTEWMSWDERGRCRLCAQDEQGLERLRQTMARPAVRMARPVLATPLTPAWDGARHAEQVERIRALIAAGDIYQANLSLPFTASIKDDGNGDIALFLALAHHSPAPYAAFFRCSDVPGARQSIISHSPECFLRCRGNQVVSEPIKGTARRQAGQETATRQALLHSAKDRAELAMIVDLVRNDLGRVAAPGSVSVRESAVVLDLPYVHHLVAQIAARLRPDRSVSEVLAAAFPAGSITGAPKIRAMQIIQDLEGAARGPYCGTFGWLGHDGASEWAVAIRTLVLADGEVRLHAGSGIVADSVGAAEWDEVRAKASAMAAVLGCEI